MRIKGVVEKIEGTKLIIELKPRVVVRRNLEKGTVEKTFGWDLPKKLPKEGSVVRINFHNKDAKDLGALEKIFRGLKP